MGIAGSNLKIGDNVKVRELSNNELKEMQEGHGGWSPNMMECIKNSCTIVQGLNKDVVIQSSSGSMYRVNVDLLYKIDESREEEITKWKCGDKVMFINDARKAEKYQKESGGWTNDMLNLLGEQVTVEGKSVQGNFRIKYGDKVWFVNPMCLERSYETNKGTLTPENSTRNLEEGRKEIVINNISEVKSLQNGHGGWSDLMNFLLGSEVEVVRILDDGDCYVKYMEMEWMLNPKVFQGISALSKKKFKIGDKVKICSNEEDAKLFQENHGGWVLSMKELLGKIGKVDVVLANDDIRVDVQGYKFVYNPLMLTPVENSDIEDSINAGDIVKVIDDMKKVKQLQMGHGEWADFMELLLGEKGQVKYIFPDGDLKVKFMDKCVTLNPKCVKKVESEYEGPSELFEMFKMLQNVYESSFDDGDDDKDGPNFNLFKAIKEGDDTKVKSIIATHGIEFHENSFSVNHLAARLGHDHIIRILVDRGVQLDGKDSANGDTPLHTAVKYNCYSTVKEILSLGGNANIQNKEGYTPCMLAVLNGYSDILKLLLETKKLDLSLKSKDEGTALHIGIQKYRVNEVQMLLNANARVEDVNKSNFSGLHLSALVGNERILELILEKTKSRLVDIQKDDKFSPIHIAALNNHKRCLEILIQYKADINIRNSKLQTPLHLAVSQKYLECIKVLIENHADINLKDEGGDTPLHDAVQGYNMDNFKKLNRFGIDSLRSKGSGHDNPEEIILYLVDKGAKINIKNRQGKTPIDICENEDLKGKMQDRASTLISTAEHGSMENNDGLPLSSDLNELDRKLYEEKLAKLLDEALCKICFDNKQDMVFGCGHMCCSQCEVNLYECHICRTLITHRIKTYNT